MKPTTGTGLKVVLFLLLVSDLDKLAFFSINPFFTKLFKWCCTELVDFKFTASAISLTEGE